MFLRHPVLDMKKLLVTLLTAPLVLGSSCQSQSYQTPSASDPNNSLVFEKCMMNDVKKNKPWVRPKPSHEDISRGPLIVSKNDEFQKGIDDPRKLLVRAREGDNQAMAKLQDYVSYERNPDRAVRLEFERMSALGQGIDGIARYYAENKGNSRMSKDCRLIEQSLRHMESEALGGNWVYAVALYQFLGSLNQRAEHLPWGGNDELSAKWLELIHKLAGKQTFDAVVTTEAARMGQSRNLNGTFFPHAPEGWKPNK